MNESSFNLTIDGRIARAPQIVTFGAVIVAAESSSVVAPFRLADRFTGELVSKMFVLRQ